MGRGSLPHHDGPQQQLQTSDSILEDAKHKSVYGMMYSNDKVLNHPTKKRFNFKRSLRNDLKVLIVEFLDDKTKLRMNLVSLIFYNDIVPKAMTCKSDHWLVHEADMDKNDIRKLKYNGYG